MTTKKGFLPPGKDDDNAGPTIKEKDNKHDTSSSSSISAAIMDAILRKDHSPESAELSVADGILESVRQYMPERLPQIIAKMLAIPNPNISKYVSERQLPRLSADERSAVLVEMMNFCLPTVLDRARGIIGPTAPLHPPPPPPFDWPGTRAPSSLHDLNKKTMTVVQIDAATMQHEINQMRLHLESLEGKLQQARLQSLQLGPRNVWE